MRERLGGEGWVVVVKRGDGHRSKKFDVRIFCFFFFFFFFFF